MPKKAKKVKRDIKVKQRATNIINNVINLDGKTKTKRRRTKQVSTKEKTELKSSYIPSTFSNPLRTPFNIVTQAPSKANDIEDTIKRLLDVQAKQFKQDMETPTPKPMAVATPTPMPTPTPKPMMVAAPKPMAVSSSSTPGYTIRLPATSSKQSILQSVKKADLVKSSSRVVSDVDSSDYAHPFESYQKTINQAFITPDSFYETDVDEAIDKQMPPPKAASASSSKDTIMETRKRNVDQAINQLVDDVVMDSFQEVQAEEQKKLIDKSKQQLDEQKYSAAESSSGDDNPGQNIQVVNLPKGAAFLMDNENPNKRLWNTGLKFSYISYPMISTKPGQDGEQYTYQVAIRQDGSIWMVRDGGNEWKTETQTLRSDAAREPFDEWKANNVASLVFPEEHKVEVKKGKGRPTKVKSIKKKK